MKTPQKSTLDQDCYNNDISNVYSQRRTPIQKKPSPMLIVSPKTVKFNRTVSLKKSQKQVRDVTLDRVLKI
jgi:hypothetical protein